MAERFRIIDCHPYLDREEEYSGLTLEEAAARMEDLTGVEAAMILADFEEACGRCEGTGEIPDRCDGTGWVRRAAVEHRCHGCAECTPGAEDRLRLCPICGGTRKRSEPWEWIDDERGREVTMRREVN